MKYIATLILLLGITMLAALPEYYPLTSIQKLSQLDQGYGSCCYAVISNDRQYIFKAVEPNAHNHPDPG